MNWREMLNTTQLDFGQKWFSLLSQLSIPFCYTGCSGEGGEEINQSTTKLYFRALDHHVNFVIRDSANKKIRVKLINVNHFWWDSLYHQAKIVLWFSE